jgi:hypothetical protein
MLLAVEDPLSEAVVRKIFAVTCSRSSITQMLPVRGSSYLKEKAESLNKAARGFPVFLLADQDDPRTCPAGLIASCLKSPQHPSFLFRVAVMAVESWVMADRKAFSRFLSIPLERVPGDTDAVLRPKELLISLARLSKSSRLREDLVPAPGGTSKVGPAYNARLTDFVRGSWNPEAAAEVSESLRRALSRLKELDA